VDCGRLCHATFRLSPAGTLPHGRSTISFGVEWAGPGDLRAELLVRLTAAAPQQFDNPLHGATRLDGAQLAGFAATLPLGGAVDPAAAGLDRVVDRRTAARLRRHTAPPVEPDAIAAMLPMLDGGLVIGVNREGAPVAVRLFRSEPTRVVLAGTAACAQLVAVRALGLGAQVIVQTVRPREWDTFLRAAGRTDGLVAVPAGRPLELAPASPARPQLLVVDAPGVRPMDLPWRATLLVRADLTAADADALTRADLALLQPLTPAAAALAGTALGLGDVAEWLTRIRGDMVGVVAGRRAVRWALLAATPAERLLVG
jgi:hypothetical protein